MLRRYTAVGGGVGDPMRDRRTLTTHLDQFREDTEFLENLRPELQKKYPNCWVAIYKKQVVGTGATLKEVIQELEKNNVPKSRAVIDYLRTEPITMVL